MKRTLLMTILGLATLTSYAATGSMTDPYSLAAGKNTVSFNGASSVYYSITPTSDKMIELSGITNCTIYSSNITATGEIEKDSFSSNIYLQTKAGNTYTIEVSKGWGNGESAFTAEIHDNPYVNITTADTPITFTPYMQFLPLGAVVPCYLTYTATEDGVLKFLFSASPKEVSYTTVKNGPYTKTVTTDYISGGGGYKGYLEVEAGKTYWFQVKGEITMLGSATLIHPVTGQDPDFPFIITPGQSTIFPKEAGTYYYAIANDGNAGYLLFHGDEPFKGTAMAGPALAYLNDKSTDRIHIRMKVAAAYKSYALKLERTTASANDQAFTATYSNEAYDIFPGQSIQEGTVITTPGYPGLYYYTFTFPTDGRNIVDITTPDNLKGSDTKASIYYANNQYSPLATGTSIKYEGVAGREYTIAWNVNQADAPLHFTFTLSSPPKGDSKDNPIDAIIGENTVPAGTTKYLKYTATQDCWLVITPGQDSGLGQPAVSMLPIPSDPYMQACDIKKEDGRYLVLAEKGRGYLIIFSNVAKEGKFTISERPTAQGYTPANPFIVENNEITLPTTPGRYWYKYTVPSTGKLEISTDLKYERSSNHQDYSFVYYYNPDNTANRLGELRPDLDNGTFANRVLNVTEGDVYLIQAGFISAQNSGKKVTLTPRGPIAGETPELAIPIPFNGVKSQYTFDRIINHVEEGVWYSLPLNAGAFSLKGTTDCSFDISVYAPEDTQHALATSKEIGVDYDEDNEKYIYVYGINEMNVPKAGSYLLFLSYNPASFTATLECGTSGISDINTPAEVTVTAGNGYMEITGGNTTVNVYDISGKAIATEKINGTSHLSLTEGIYIVKAGNKTFKVAIR